MTAAALVLGQGGPRFAVLTSLAAVVIAAFAGNAAAKLLDRVLSFISGLAKKPVVAEDPYSF